ncbi:MAG: c-type cytochrome [Betaproteobacteria bacterium]|nr:c-type cytochrome [Betaproteobacteria bacterium]
MKPRNAAGARTRVTQDRHRPGHRALFKLFRESRIWHRVNVRTCQYLNNLIEQHHRALNARTGAMLGFETIVSPARPIVGIELVDRIRKGQFHVQPETGTQADAVEANCMGHYTGMSYSAGIGESHRFRAECFPRKFRPSLWKPMGRAFLLIVCTALVMPYGVGAQAAETAAPTQPQSSTSQATGSGPPKQDFSVKNTFRNICGFCHENYGRKGAKGPQLMGTELTDDQIFNRIKNGKPGRMAAFGVAFTDDQIRDIVTFIRALRPDVDP